MEGGGGGVMEKIHGRERKGSPFPSEGEGRKERRLRLRKATVVIAGPEAQITISADPGKAELILLVLLLVRWQSMFIVARIPDKIRFCELNK
jgi:hypothetical protein